MFYEKQNYIDGRWVGEGYERMKVTNPATGRAVGTVPRLGANEVREAVEAADRAFSDWAALTAAERSRYLRRVYRMMMEQQEELAALMTLEMGKPLKEARGEVAYAASFLEWYAEEAKRVYGRIIPGKDPAHRIQVIKQPVGVVAAITPWNFPAAMITRKLAPALAAGCTMIIKPAEQSPLTAVKLMECCEAAGIPQGVVQLITGKPEEIGDALIEHPKVKKLTFTGSTAVGKLLLEKSARHVKKVSLELGGHAPVIVLDDADMEKAVQGTVASKFRNAGQTCICANRIYVQSGIYDAFAESFRKEVEKLKVGDGFAEDTDIGPLINKDGFDKVNAHIRDAVERGAKVITGGKPLSEKDGAYFYPPTIIQDVTEEMKIMREETFGPVAPLQRFERDEEAVALANRTPYGLAAYIFTENISRGTKLAEALEYGIIGWNDGIPSAVQAPFGGMKESGIGREGGTEGLEEYLETKYLSLRL